MVELNRVSERDNRHFAGAVEFRKQDGVELWHVSGVTSDGARGRSFSVSAGRRARRRCSRGRPRAAGTWRRSARLGPPSRRLSHGK